jgi:8-oxo-dGTP pyrophosphatase MutT (NUDIX family)
LWKYDAWGFHLKYNRITVHDLTEKQIQQQFSLPLEEPKWIGPSGILRRAAVLIPLYLQADEWHVLFTRRTNKVQDHKGQVSFPGGGLEPKDNGVEEAAIREACEEIGLCVSDVLILGRLPDYETVTRFMVSPVIARIRWPFELRIEEKEVSRVFSIPLGWLAERKSWHEFPMLFPTGRRENVIIYKKYDGELLWGVTARIMVNLLERLTLNIWKAHEAR